MAGRGPAGFLFLCLLTGSAHAQEAPYLTVLPRQEQGRRWEQSADLRMVQKRYLEAIDLYEAALALNPGNAVLLNKLGIAHHQLLRLDDAKKFYERSSRADRHYANAWNNLGTIYYGKKDYKKAVRYYERALKESPAQAAIHSNLGTALFARKKYDQALEEYRLALLLDPEVFEKRARFGVLLQEQTVEDRARYSFLLAKGFASLGYVDRCIAFLRRALEDGFSPLEAQGDPAFVLVRDDPRFQELFAQQPVTLPR